MTIVAVLLSFVAGGLAGFLAARDPHEIRRLNRLVDGLHRNCDEAEDELFRHLKSGEVGGVGKRIVERLEQFAGKDLEHGEAE